MRTPVIAALITLLVMSAACGNPTGTQSAPSPPPPASATAATPPATGPPGPRNIEQLCNSLTWPRPMPAVVGLILDDFSSDMQPLTCLKNVRGIGPDGNVVYEHDDHKIDGYNLVAGVSPPPGTPVGPDDPVTVNLVFEGSGSPPPAYHPCEWVTTSEATAFVGGPPLVSSEWEGTSRNAQGSTDPQCDYFDRPDFTHEINSQLRLTGAHIVDAASEFAFKTGEDSTSVAGIGIKAACTWPQPLSTGNDRQLYVLLPGERIYVATGRYGESCDTLKKFARAAVPRIGP